MFGKTSWRTASVVSIFALAMTGCSVAGKLGDPYSETKEDPNVANVIRLVNFSGKLGCTLVVNEMGKGDVANTRKAVEAAKVVLASEAPTYQALDVVFNQFVPQKALPYLILGLDEVKASFGEVLVDKQSTAFAGATALVEGCDSALVASGN